jgi:hypothetical protein
MNSAYIVSSKQNRDIRRKLGVQDIQEHNAKYTKQYLSQFKTT